MEWGGGKWWEGAASGWEDWEIVCGKVEMREKLSSEEEQERQTVLGDAFLKCPALKVGYRVARC
jgi:hypothetical protein